MINKNSFVQKLNNVYHTIVLVFIISLFTVFSLIGNHFTFILGIGLIFISFYLYSITPDKYKSLRIKYTPLWIWISTFFTRLIYCIFVSKNMTQISDFATTLEAAARGDFANHPCYYPTTLHKFIYTYLLNVLHLTTQFNIFIFQCFCVSFIPVIIFYIGKNVKNYKLGLCSAIIYLLWPSNIIYSTIIVEDHLAGLFITAIILLLFKLFDNLNSKKEVKKTIIYSVSIGMLCGAITYFKDWGLIILVAFIISSIYLLILDKKYFSYLLFSFLIILSARFIVKEVIHLQANYVLQTETSDNIIVSQLYVALDPNSDGGCNQDLYSESTAIRNSDSGTNGNKKVLQATIAKITDNLSSMPLFLAKKGRNAYEDDEICIQLATKDSLDEHFYNDHIFFFSTVNLLSKVFYVIVVMGIIFSALLIKDKKIFFINLCIIGGIMVSLLIESQSRYKYSIEPIWTITAAYGLSSIYHKFISLYNTLKENRKSK